MSDSKFVAALNEQIGHEYAAHQQYVAIAVHFEADTLPQLAGFFYRQAVEERNHAMMIVQYMLDRDLPVEIPGIEAPKTDFGDYTEPIEMSLNQEKTVTDQIESLVATAREEGDFQGEQFMQWFLKEQVEEVATMSDLMTTVERERSPLEIERFVAREMTGEGADPTAPAAAGGAL